MYEGIATQHVAIFFFHGFDLIDLMYEGIATKKIWYLLRISQDLIDLMYEGIATIWSRRNLFSASRDLIDLMYEGIATLFGLGEIYFQPPGLNWPDVRRDCDAKKIWYLLRISQRLNWPDVRRDCDDIFFAFLSVQ